MDHLFLTRQQEKDHLPLVSWSLASPSHTKRGMMFTLSQHLQGNQCPPRPGHFGACSEFTSRHDEQPTVIAQPLARHQLLVNGRESCRVQPHSAINEYFEVHISERSTSSSPCKSPSLVGQDESLPGGLDEAGWMSPHKLT